jgi:ribosomal protein S18 acetylase RimI-like enzyme
MDQLILRAGADADLPAMHELWRRAVRARRGGVEQSSEEAIDASRTLDNGNSFAILAFSGETLVGMGLGLTAREDDGLGPPIPGLCHISMVAVTPGWWGRGIGARIVTDLLDAIRARGYTRAQLWTQHSNSRARRLYERFGFRESGRRKHDDAGEVILLYVRAL